MYIYIRMPPHQGIASLWKTSFLSCNWIFHHQIAMEAKKKFPVKMKIISHLPLEDRSEIKIISA